MGLRSWLARVAVGRVHVLVVESPGSFAVRVAVEHEVVRRGWCLVEAPADADLVVVVGSPGPELVAAADLVHDQLPGPRARVTVTTTDGAGPALDQGAATLCDPAEQEADARGRAASPPDDSDHDMGDMDHDTGDMDHDTGDMEMAPAGIPLASGADDRDGLEMDELHLPLGPVLRSWPPGLVLRCTLHGDVVAAAEVEQWSAAVAGPEEWRSERAAHRLDAAAAALELCGDRSLARELRRLRDDCLAEEPSVAGRVTAARRRVATRRTLGWSLGGLGTLDDDELLPGLAAGGTRELLVHLLDAAADELAGTATATAPPERLRGALPGLAQGRELSEVRLLVTCLAPFLTGTRERAGHG